MLNELNRTCCTGEICRWGNRTERAQSFSAPQDYRLVHLAKDCQFGSASIALLCMIGKVLCVRLGRFVVEIGNQVFSPLANWSFVILLHTNYLAFVDRLSRGFTELF